MYNLYCEKYERLGMHMLQETSIDTLNFNPFNKIGKEWMLITAGNGEKINTMTASWGAMGVMWGVNTVTVYIRQSRYTKEFIDNNDTFTISVLGEQYRKALTLLGTVSGRDRDKIGESGLTPCFLDNAPAFEEADMVMVCRKLYEGYMSPENFTAAENDAKWYSDKDYHTMYIAEIKKVFVNK